MCEAIHGIKFVSCALFYFQAVCIQTVRHFIQSVFNNPMEPCESLEYNHIDLVSAEI
jgi:hypothetical protein